MDYYKDEEQKSGFKDVILTIVFLLSVGFIVYALYCIGKEIYTEATMTEEQKIAEKRAEIEKKINEAEKLCNGRKGCSVCIDSTGRYCKVYYSVE